MTTLTHVQQGRQPATRLVAAGVGLLALGVGSLLAWYAAYGDPHPKQDQKDAVPAEIVIAAVVAAIVFGALLPMALRSVREHRDRATTWALAMSIVSFATIMAFWSGIPVIIGTAATWVAWEGRAIALRAADRARPYTIALVLGAIAVVLPLAWTVVNNELM